MTSPTSAQRNFVLGQDFERGRIIALLEAECECDHDHRCTYHRMITIIKEGNK